MNKFLNIILLAFFCNGVLLTMAGNSLALDIPTGSRLLEAENSKTISMDFKDANLNDVLKIFSQQSGLNFIAETSLSGKTLNLYLDNVPVEEALERILSANSLTYELSPGSNIFVVKELSKPAVQLMTRTYPLRNASVPSSKLNKTLGDLSSSSKDSSSSSEENKSGGILEAVKNILTSNGTVVEDPRTNSLIVTDLPSQFPLIEQTISKLDVRVPQILIEAEMLDISKNTADLLGAKFGSSPLTFNGAQKDSYFPFNDQTLEEKGFGFEERQYRVSTLNFQGLTFTLQFLRTQSDTKNLARPRILTLNNETALIQIKTDEAIGSSGNTIASEGTSSSVTEAERVETGVFLRVTPQANVESGEITMAIEPKVVQARTGGTFGGITFKDPEERGSKSILRIIDGDTIVIGGLLRTNSDNTKTKVPFLSSIPIMGGAFRHKDKNESERELIIFITPHILKDDFPLTPVLSNNKNSQREQNIPSGKYQAVNNAMTSIEHQR